MGLPSRGAGSPRSWPRHQRKPRRASAVEGKMHRLCQISCCSARNILPLLCLAPPRSIFLTASFPFFSTYLSTKCFPSFPSYFYPLIIVISWGRWFPGVGAGACCGQLERALWCSRCGLRGRPEAALQQSLAFFACFK